MKLVSERGVLHHCIFEVILILVALHVAANLIYQFGKREPLITAMLTGEKPAGGYVDQDEASGSSLILALHLPCGRGGARARHYQARRRRAIKLRMRPHAARCYFDRLVAACAFLAWSLSGVCAQMSSAEAQKANPDQCEDGDQACVQAWFKEYSAGIIGEFRYYAGQEDFLADMLTDRQEPLITAKLSLLLIGGNVRYSQWALIKDESVAEGAHLDMQRYRTVTGACRDAISTMRTALFDLRQRREAVRGEATQYLKDATACEKAMGLAPTPSRLRGKPARAPRGSQPQPSATSGDGAASGPMEIAPRP